MHHPETGTSYEQLFAAAQGIGSRLWLLDNRRRNNEDSETAQWFLNDYMPQLAAHFGGPTFLAYLLSPAHLVRVDDEILDIVHVAQLQRSVHVALFIEEGAANEWLVLQAGK